MEKEAGFLNGWLTHSEIAHAAADTPESEFAVTGTVLKGRGGDNWDAASVHNPSIYYVENKYYMFYIGNRDAQQLCSVLELQLLKIQKDHGKEYLMKSLS